MVSEQIKTKLKRLSGTLLLTLFSIIMIWVTKYFEIPLALPGFLASLFFIWVLPKAKYSKFTNVASSYVFVILFGLLTSFGVFQTMVSGLGLPIESSTLGLTLAIFLSALMMILFSSEHPPALAALVFFAYSELTLHSLIGFTTGFVILIGVQMVIFAVNKSKKLGLKLGEEDNDDDDTTKTEDQESKEFDLDSLELSEKKSKK